MNLMLLVIFLCVGFGLWAPRLGRGQHLAIAFLATTMTALYFFFSARFM
jgi:hypothetical protein